MIPEISSNAADDMNPATELYFKNLYDMTAPDTNEPIDSMSKMKKSTLNRIKKEETEKETRIIVSMFHMLRSDVTIPVGGISCFGWNVIVSDIPKTGIRNQRRLYQKLPVCRMVKNTSSDTATVDPPHVMNGT